MKTALRALLGTSLLAALAAANPAFAQLEQGRVISSTPIRTPDGVAGYSVTYEYAGRQYTTRTDSPPGKSIPLQVTPMGVATSSPGQDAQQYADDAGDQQQAPMADNGDAPWRTAVPEPGVVVSGTGAPAVYPGAAYPYPAPAYGYPAPVYAPAPVYGYGYGYGYPYAYPPIGVSLNLGYSRGWGGGYYRRGWR
ncbi:hypothetical protein QTI66_06890 [Variovorax sp. J22R133]|uniref:hypothetical protein n=1 Tax=Variovorax brevis TaxID=3053503 RepID=UPI00257890F0|nr:hypothetical protein [Variovorax sp. J22R133]MDM0111870.1 hypothetical protein [Variovorax sp. J22R133]